MAVDVVICGAGIGGLTASLVMARQGCRVTVVEQADGISEVGAGLQLSPNAMHVLNALGVGETIVQRGFEPEAATIRHHASGRVLTHIALQEICASRYGASYIHIHRADLVEILHDAALDAGIVLRLGEKAKSVTDDGTKAVLLTSRNEYTSDLLVGADGLRSIVRQSIMGQYHPTFTGQVAWRGVVPTEAVPDGLVRPDATVWSGPGRHLVTYYLKGGSLINFVAVEERSDWQDPSWTSVGDIARLRRAFSGWHPDVTSLLDAVPETFIWALFGLPVLTRWSKGPITLLGDAVHPTLPFMAQGAAMAIEDAWVLSKCLESGPVPEALAQYENIRKPRTIMLQRRARKNAKLFHRDNGILDVWQRAKLNASSFVPSLALKQLDPIYGMDVTAKIN